MPDAIGVVAGAAGQRDQQEVRHRNHQQQGPYNWLKGARPRRRLPYLVAQILSDRLREPITVEALWPQHFPAAQDPAAQATGFRAPGTSGAAEPGPDLIAAAVDWLVVGEADAPSRLHGDELPAVAVDLLTTRIRQLRELDDAFRGTPLVLEWALQDFQWARRLATECCYDAETGVRLHRGIAELGQLAGWLAADLGMTRRSRSCFVTALHATHTAGDRALAAYIISCMSYHATWEGRGEEALRLIRIARKGSAVEDMGIGAALLATREARAHASLGDETGCSAGHGRGGRAQPATVSRFYRRPLGLLADPGRHGGRRRPGLAGTGPPPPGGAASGTRHRTARGEPAAEPAAAPHLTGRGPAVPARRGRRGGSRP
ncbi:hypothetical protein ACQ4WX_17360 [Streptomyces lasalocidi]